MVQVNHLVLAVPNSYKYKTGVTEETVSESPNSTPRLTIARLIRMIDFFPLTS